MRRSRGQTGLEVKRACIFPFPEGAERKAALIIPNVEVMSAAGATTWTDGLIIYKRLGTTGHRHGTVCHDREFRSAAGVSTNGVEGLWSHMKGRYGKDGGFIGVLTAKIEEFVLRCSFLYNCRRRGEDPVRVILRHMAASFVV